MYIETSKEIGSKVYFLKPIRKVKCSLCNGTGHISLGKPLNVEDGYESPSEFVQSLVHQFAENYRDAVIGNIKQYKCPECGGKGMVKAMSPKYEVGEGTVVAINMIANTNGANMMFAVSEEGNGSTPRKLTDDEIWLDRDKAQRKCDFMNLERRLVPIELIQIPRSFANTIPCNEKLMRRLDEWRKTRKFDTEIFVDEKLNLFDGYTSFLMYRMLGKIDIPVVIWPDEKRP